MVVIVEVAGGGAGVRAARKKQTRVLNCALVTKHVPAGTWDLA